MHSGHSNKELRLKLFVFQGDYHLCSNALDNSLNIAYNVYTRYMLSYTALPTSGSRHLESTVFTGQLLLQPRDLAAER